jgi:hypothetical protein
MSDLDVGFRHGIAHKQPSVREPQLVVSLVPNRLEKRDAEMLVIAECCHARGNAARTNYASPKLSVKLARDSCLALEEPEVRWFQQPRKMHGEATFGHNAAAFRSGRVRMSLACQRG